MTRRTLAGVAVFVAALLSGAKGSAVSARAAAPSLPAEGAPAPATLQAGTPLRYVYHGKLYELRGTSVEFKPTFEVNASRYARVVSAQFAMKNLADGVETRFALSYAIDGRLAEVPLTMTYEPRWWMQIKLALADDVDSSLMGALDQ